MPHVSFLGGVPISGPMPNLSAGLVIFGIRLAESILLLLHL